MNVLFICSSNQDRSPAMEKYFTVHYPQHSYKSAGVNKYHTTSKGNTYLSCELLDWADLIVLAEKIHLDKVIQFVGMCTFNNYLIEFSRVDFDYSNKNRKYIILGLGKYEKGNINEDYLKRAEQKLKSFISL